MRDRSLERKIIAEVLPSEALCLDRNPVIVQRDRSSNLENQTTKSPRHEEVRGEFSQHATFSTSRVIGSLCVFVPSWFIPCSRGERLRNP